MSQIQSCSGPAALVKCKLQPYPLDAWVTIRAVIRLQKAAMHHLYNVIEVIDCFHVLALQALPACVRQLPKACKLSKMLCRLPTRD